MNFVLRSKRGSITSDCLLWNWRQPSGIRDDQLSFALNKSSCPKSPYRILGVCLILKMSLLVS